MCVCGSCRFFEGGVSEESVAVEEDGSEFCGLMEDGLFECDDAGEHTAVEACVFVKDGISESGLCLES